MRRWTLVGVALLALLAAACGGGGDKKTVDVGDGQVTIGGDLPDSFPDDFPVYDGADFQGSFQGEQQGVEGLVANWTSGDDLSDVVAFYNGEFGDGPWKTTASGNAQGVSFWSVQNNDKSKVGYVSVSESDGQVAILVIVGDDVSGATGDDGSSDGSDGSSGDGSDDSSGDDGSGDSSGGDAQLPDEVDLSDDFPTDVVGLPDGARVTDTSSISAGGGTTHFVTFYSKDSADDLDNYFKDELEGNGYTQSVRTSDGNGVYAAYAENADGTGTVVIVTVADADVSGYRQVSLSVTTQQ